jgi:cell division protein FtsB
MATHLDASLGVGGCIKRRVLALAALVVVLATFGFIAWRHQTEVAARRAHQAEVAGRRTQAQARIDALSKKQGAHRGY